MRIAVMGAGGQGGLFGGLLAKAGEEVTLIARGAHLEAIQSRGLTLKSDKGVDTTIMVNATSNPAEVGPVDLVLFSVKTYDLDAAAEQALPLMEKKTVVLPVQNGIGIVERLSEVFGSGAVIGGTSYLSGKIESPGTISYGGVSGKLFFGELDGNKSPRVEKILDIFQKANIEAELHTNIRVAIWEKFIVNCASGGIMALLRLPMGPILDCRESRALLLGVMEEAEAIAQAKDIGLPEGTAKKFLDFFRTNVAPSARSSLLMDITTGRRLEIEPLNGAVVRIGRELEIPTPLNFAVYAALKPYVNGAPIVPE